MYSQHVWELQTNLQTFIAKDLLFNLCLFASRIRDILSFFTF